MNKNDEKNIYHWNLQFMDSEGSESNEITLSMLKQLIGNSSLLNKEKKMISREGLLALATAWTKDRKTRGVDRSSSIRDYDVRSKLKIDILQMFVYVIKQKKYIKKQV